jgi:4-hydroxy-2-oxoglutarate aldolase
VAAIRRNIGRWLEGGVRGVVALGSTGEAALLDERESDVVVEAARQAVPSDRVLIVGTARESTRGTIAATRRATKLGADAVLVRTPSFYKSRMTQDAFVTHYTEIADAVRVPVLLYNFPGLTGVNLAPESVAQLADHPNIIGVKETSTDAAQIAAFVDGTQEKDFAVLAGSAPSVYAALCLGATGAILAAACVLPHVCVEIFESHRRGGHERAHDLQRRLTPLAQAITSTHGIPGLKAAMEMAGFSGGAPRHPLMPAPEAARQSIRRALEAVQAFV